MDHQLCSYEFNQSSGNLLVLRFSEILNRFFRNPISSSSKLRTRPIYPHPFDYNKLMKEFNQAGQIDQVIRLFREMKDLNLRIDVVCYTTVMDSLVTSNCHEQALAVFEEMMLDNVAPDKACCTVLVKMYSLHLKQFDSAYEVIHWMRNCGCFPDVVTYTTLIVGLCWDGRVEEAFGVLDHMLDAECMPNVYTYTPIIQAYCSMGRIPEAKRLVKAMEGAGCLPNNVTFNILIEAFCRIGAFDEVNKVLKESKLKHWKPDEITYSIYMNGLCKWRKADEAFRQLDFMLASGLVPNSVTLNILLDCLCSSSLALEAKGLLEKSFELEWDVDVFNYNTVMRTLCNDGRYWAVLKLFSDMLKKNVAANAWTLSIVVHSLCKAGKLQKAKCILDGEGLEANAVAYATLIHYYYMNGQIDETPSILHFKVGPKFSLLVSVIVRNPRRTVAGVQSSADRRHEPVNFQFVNPCKDMRFLLVNGPSSRRRLRAFKRWMRLQGIEYSDALEFVDDSPEDGIWVRALCCLREGDLVAAIPKSACVTIRTSGISSVIESAGLSGFLGLAVALMYERSLGTASPWHGYLQLLPLRECVPIIWTSDEVDELLVGTELHKTVKEDKRFLHEDWKHYIEPLILSGPLMIDPKSFSVEQYFAAKSLVSSRSFDIDDYHGFGMVPLADLFNHKTGGEHVHFTLASPCSSSDDEGDFGVTDTSGDESSSMKYFDGISGYNSHPVTLEMIVVREIDPGAEVFNTYGTIGNAALLHRYGFTEPDNPYDIVNIDLELVMRWCFSKFSNRYGRSRLSLWRKLSYSGFTSQDSEYFEVSFEGEPQKELVILLYIMLISESEYQKLNIMIDHFTESDDATKLLKLVDITQADREKNPQDFKELLLTGGVCHALVSLADIRDSLYGQTSVKEDICRLGKCCRLKGKKIYHSLVLRVGERKILGKLKAYAFKRLRTIRSRPRKQELKCC
ncbi:Pentatricopeptide repeat-containing protein [Apostasia shenzhenica]|uniref:Pentatricopeptide repeat-containing protein n=1 Tax=Apostasia shenzhenica TaxID=1088818 RepID=A0A2I0A2Y2_9ASPA|nr:Pentatricopeptide repeat-containing protein [Apostasia shenzhenica]